MIFDPAIANLDLVDFLFWKSSDPVGILLQAKHPTIQRSVPRHWYILSDWIALIGYLNLLLHVQLYLEVSKVSIYVIIPL